MARHVCARWGRRAHAVGVVLVLSGTVLTPMAAGVAVASPASASTASYVATSSIPLGGGVSQIVVDPGGSVVYATAGRTLKSVDTSTGTVAGFAGSYAGSPTGLALSPDGSILYASTRTQYQYGYVEVADVANRTLAAASWNPETNYPSGVAVDPQTGLLYVNGGDTYNGRDDYSVSVINPGTGRRIAEISTPYAYRGVAVDPRTSQVYVTNLRADSVSIIDAPSGTLVATIPVGDQPQAVAVDPRTSQVYVVNELSGTVSVIDGPSRAVVATLPVGRYPYAVAVDPRTSRVFIANSGDATVSVIDGPTSAVVDTFPSIAYATEIAVDPTNSRLYVSSEYDEHLTVMEPPSAPAVDGAPSSSLLEGEPFDYSYTLTGAPRPTTTVTGGTLPPGLTLSPDGRLSGTPTEGGTYTFTVTGASSEGSDAVTSTIQVNVRPGIDGQPPSPGLVGTSYDFSYDLSGTPAPTVAITDGVLPAGLALTRDGRLSGTPTEVGTSSFTVTATNSAGPASITSSVEVLPVLTASINDVRGYEGGAGVTSPFTFTVSLNRPSTREETLHFTTRDGAATSADPTNSDYQALAGTVTFLAGTTSMPVTVQVVGESTFEPDETFVVEFTTSQSGPLLLDGTGVGTIVNDDALPRISIGDKSTVEGNRGTKTLRFPVQLDRPSSSPVTVRFRTTTGTARTPRDFAAISGTVTFPAYSTAQVINVRVKGDRVKERREMFTVSLSAPSGATTGRAAARGTIVDND
jgi:YVTN family beta-propeller protein